MAEDTGNGGDGGGDGAGDGDDDGSSLPDDAKSLLKHIGRVTRDQMNSVLDERLRVEPEGGSGGGKGGSGDGSGSGDSGGDGAGDGSSSGSLAAKLGFGG